MQLLRIAARNLTRSPARTALSVIAVAASVMAVMIMRGTAGGIIDTIEDSTVRLAAGHVRIINEEYAPRQRLLSLQHPVDGFAGEGVSSMAEALAALPGVEAAAPRLRFGGMISRGDDLRGVMAVGVVPELEAEILRTGRYLDQGRFVRSGEREAVLGFRLLERLGLGVGDRFTLVFNSAFGALRGYTFEVAGVFRSGLTYLDDGTVFIPLDVAQAAVDLGDAATEIVLMTGSTGRADRVAEEAKKLLAQRGAAERHRVVPWHEHNEMMPYLFLARRIYDLIYLIFLFLASFVVINTFVMIVHERRQEIGMLSALGLRPGQIRTLFILEGGVCGLLGSLAGAALGTPLLWLLSRTGIPIPGTESMGAELMFPTTVYPAFESGAIGFALAGGVAVTLAAVYLPARQAAGMRPTEALRA